MDGLERLEERHVETPFGEPSDAFVLGRMHGITVAFLPRHGRGHRLLPSELNFRANLWAMKQLGVQRIVSLSAVGSMRERYAPTHIVVPHQFIDRTRHRPDTFFGEGIAAHVGFADPICRSLAAVLYRSGREVGVTMHEGGTYLCMEGPQFSTRAESHTYRSWDVDVIGMTNLQEAKLAREAEICYATLALVTDYDCWHEEEDDVSVHNVVGVLEQNARAAQQIVSEIVRSIAGGDPAGRCSCHDALLHAIMTAPDRIPDAALHRLWPIVGRYFPGRGPDDTEDPAAGPLAGPEQGAGA
ncbi:MAG: S-methyl-5'-thioadenosine phosphorylase [Acidobacteria bacterium]|nr:MAG: S-methyl-5'-thioadenosine phosphorylase [Acidobacteriota bacterium]